jgi:undecaprenyl-diphosphatase
VTPLTAALLGVVQGLTEFLPVSSSAHLILVRAFFGWDGEALGATWIAFDVACHVGTLLAVVFYFWSDLAAMLVSLPDALSRRPGLAGRRIQLIVLGTLPVVVVGLAMTDEIASRLRTPAVAATMLALGAVLFLVAERIGRRPKSEDEMSAGNALAIGLAQSAALVPGVSRSGATIAVGMLAGIARPAAARFTFLLSVPAILAAAVKEGLELRHLSLTSSDLQLFAIGMATSGIVGYLVVRFLIRYLASHRLDVFAWYRLALAAATFVWIARG